MSELLDQSRSVSPGDLILVTGATGYIAAHIVQQLLEGGYRVRGTARDPESDKSHYLKKLFAAYGEKFEIAKAGDLEDPGVFDEAVKGVDGIAHVASPFHFKVKDPYSDLINPAVVGTTSILCSAQKYGPNVKHIVVTSSVAAIYGTPKPKGYIYTEADWNDKAVEDIKSDPVKFNEFTAYRASKNAAERAAWKFVDEQNPAFGVSTINPCYVFGPVIHKINNVDQINTSVALLFNYFANPTEIGANGPPQGFVDVRDVAKMHIRALERPSAVGKRFIAYSDKFTWQDIVNVLKSQFPKGQYATRGPGAGVLEIDNPTDNSRSRELLGIQYTELTPSVIATISSLVKFWPER